MTNNAQGNGNEVSNEKIKAICKIVQSILKRENRIESGQEHFWIVGLDYKNDINFIELVELDGINQSSIDPKEVYRMSVLKEVTKLVLVHNHPDETIKPEDLEPEGEDNDITDRLIQTGKLLGLEVVEHLIITEEHYFSYRQSGLLEELEKSTRWVPPYIIEQKKSEESAKE